MKLIIFFNGWSINKNILINNDDNIKILNISFPYDYNIKYLNLNSYEDVFFIAWSFGVFYLNKFLNENKTYLKYKNIAINGNPKLIGKYGINEKIFYQTYNNLNIENKILFDKNMNFNNEEEYSLKDIDSYKNELEYFIQIYNTEYKDLIKNYLISTKDTIIPYFRQKKYVDDLNLNYKIINAKHFIFDLYDLKEIIGEFYEI